MKQKLQQVIIDILNARLQDEFNAERFYIAGANFCDLNGFDIASDFFVREYEDERRHAHKLIKFAANWNVRLTLPTVSKDMVFNDLPSVVKMANDMELGLFDAYCADIKAIRKDYPQIEIFLQKFVKIQNEAVITYSNMLKKLEGINSKAELLLIEEKVFG